MVVVRLLLTSMHPKDGAFKLYQTSGTAGCRHACEQPLASFLAQQCCSGVFSKFRFAVSLVENKCGLP
jgi:hypothetical protein